MKFYKVLLLGSFFLSQGYSQDSSLGEFVSSDFLGEIAQTQKEKDREEQLKKQAEIKRKYDFPSEEEFWNIFSEYWMVKNVKKLHWDLPRADYALEENLKKTFEKLGWFELKIQVVITQSPDIPHLALPSSLSRPLFIVAEPFLRSLNLSKEEIALLLAEDYLYLQMGFLRKKLSNAQLQGYFSSNFYPQKLEDKFFKDLVAKMDRWTFQQGFSLQEDYQVFQKMLKVLSSNPELLGIYRQMMLKIQELPSLNKRYQGYARLYPSLHLRQVWMKNSSL